MEPFSSATIAKAIAGALIKWLVGQGLSRAQQFAFPNDLMDRIGKIAEAWRKSLPADATLHDFRSILATHYPQSIDNPPPEPTEIVTKLRASQLPTADEWLTVLLRQWEWVKSVIPEPAEFFQIDKARAEILLNDLAERIVRECHKDQLLVTGQSLAYLEQHGALLERILIAVETPREQADPSGYHPRIDAAIKYTKSGQPDIAIVQLEALRRADWNRMDDRERYRTVANLGHAHNAKGDEETAARCFLECKQYQPNDEKARALEAVGHYMLGNERQAWELADAVLTDYPTSDLACAIRVRCEPATRTFADIERDVPSALKAFPETQVALSLRALQSHDFREAERLARLAHNSGEYSATVAEHLAVVLLNLVRSETEQQLIASPILGPLDTHVVEAQQLLLRAIEMTPAVAYAARGRLRFFQGLASQLLGNTFDADSHFRAAFETNPKHPDYIRQLALIQYDLDRLDEAIRVLKAGTPHDGTGQLTFMLASCLLDRNAKGDSDEAVTYLEAISKPELS
jgi:tetratricopeptide (TPR) repeat protein